MDVPMMLSMLLPVSIYLLQIKMSYPIQSIRRWASAGAAPANLLTVKIEILFHPRPCTRLKMRLALTPFAFQFMASLHQILSSATHRFVRRKIGDFHATENFALGEKPRLS